MLYFLSEIQLHRRYWAAAIAVPLPSISKYKIQKSEDAVTQVNTVCERYKGSSIVDQVAVDGGNLAAPICSAVLTAAPTMVVQLMTTEENSELTPVLERLSLVEQFFSPEDLKQVW